MNLKNTVACAIMAATFVLGRSTVTAQTVITFDDLGLVTNSIVTDQYSALGATFSAPAGGTTRIATATSAIFPAEPQGLYNDAPGIFDIGFTDPIIVDFSFGVSSAGAFIDFGDAGTGIKVEAFDGAGGTGQLLGSDSTVAETFIGVSAPDIRSIVFSQAGIEGSTYLIDNVTFVPEPSSLVLLGFGVIFLLRRDHPLKTDTINS